MCVCIFLIKEGKEGGKMVIRRLWEEEKKDRDRVERVICPGPTAIKPGGRN